MSFVFHPRLFTLLACLGSTLSASPAPQPVAAPAGQVPLNWRLAFADEFNGRPDAWRAHWRSDAGSFTHILSSRWPENVVIEKGVLRLLNRKENRGGQEWTAGSIGTLRQFKYGYFEARYRYGAAPGLNNSFWLMTRGVPRAKIASGETSSFELDINEGHYPNEIATNIHRWEPRPHLSDSRKVRLGSEPATSIPLEIPVATDALRMIVRDLGRVSVSELRAFAPTREGYPKLLDVNGSPLTTPTRNLLDDAQAVASGQIGPSFGPENTVDGVASNSSRWVVGPGGGPHVLTLTLPSRRTLGCVQLFNGWRKGEAWQDVPTDYSIQYRHADGRWIDISQAGGDGAGFKNLSAGFHTYGMLWTPKEIVFYFDGRELRREANLHAHHQATVYLSSAVIHWAGPVTDAINGTSMDVDYVRIWQPSR